MIRQAKELHLKICSILDKGLLAELLHKEDAIILDDLLKGEVGDFGMFSFCDILSICAKHLDPTIRSRVAELIPISDCDDTAALEVLSQLLSDNDWLVRCSSMFSIGQRKLVSMRAMIEDRYKSRNSAEKYWALMAIVEMHSSECRPFLLKVFDSAKNAKIKSCAAAGLVLLGDESAERFLFKELDSPINNLIEGRREDIEFAINIVCEGRGESPKYTNKNSAELQEIEMLFEKQKRKIYES